MLRDTLKLCLCTVLALGSCAALARSEFGSGAEVTRAPDGRVRVVWHTTEPTDVYVGSPAYGDSNRLQLVSDGDVDGRHEFEFAPDRRPYVTLKRERDGATRVVAERVLQVESGSNFRDVGGYETTDGRRVRWGLIYRSGAMPQLTDRDYEYLGSLGIRVFCDLRSEEERDLSPTRSERFDGARYVAVDYPASSIFRRLTPTTTASTLPLAEAPVTDLYREWPTSLAPQFAEIFRALLAEEAPMASNCSAGQDRTGVATALVLSALGVPRETILEDYHLSTIARRPEFELNSTNLETLADTNPVARFYVETRKQGPEALKPKPLFNQDGKARLLATFDEIENRWGSVPNYLSRVLNVDEADVARLRSLYLE